MCLDSNNCRLQRRGLDCIQDALETVWRLKFSRTRAYTGAFDILFRKKLSHSNAGSVRESFSILFSFHLGSRSFCSLSWRRLKSRIECLRCGTSHLIKLTPVPNIDPHSARLTVKDDRERNNRSRRCRIDFTSSDRNINIFIAIESEHESRNVVENNDNESDRVSPDIAMELALLYRSQGIHHGLSLLSGCLQLT